MLWKEYIEYLSQNTLPKSIIDNTVNVPQQPIYITPYEQAVLNGFKGSEKVFNTKFQIDKKLDETSTAIHNTIDTKIHEIKQKIADQTQNTQSTIQKIEDEIGQFQNIINKRINDTNDKITKKNEITLGAIKEILPKVENIVEVKAKTITKTIETVKKDIEGHIKTVYENIQDINSILDITQKNIKKKANTSHKHDTSDINTLDEVIVSINKSITERGVVNLDRTITPALTVGAQTINKPSGTVNFAAGASTLVVTNSLVTTSSNVFAVVRTADATALIKSVVPIAGSFTITLNANATAETSVGFLVMNS